MGTDSLLCLDTPERISVLDEMRFLHRRDGTDPYVLLGMATVNGAQALGIDVEPVTFRPGATAGVLACAIDPDSDVDPLVQVMQRDDPPEWVAGA
jgi:cytosine/adenosine deaminase-related metal-dependent hydrolase